MEAAELNSIEPFGPTAGYLQAALITASLKNAFGGDGDGNAYKPADFMPLWDEPEPPVLSPEQEQGFWLRLQDSQNKYLESHSNG